MQDITYQQEVEVWDKSIENSINLVQAVKKDWEDFGSVEKADAAQYILNILEGCKRS